ncbi:hypothetical protein HK102_007265 [Quaeritorhiza haematococci]|nr:hypothetical protein HK102_007265 [Quaeritorhiza haematococci]
MKPFLKPSSLPASPESEVEESLGRGHDHNANKKYHVNEAAAFFISPPPSFPHIAEHSDAARGPGCEGKTGLRRSKRRSQLEEVGDCHASPKRRQSSRLAAKNHRVSTRHPVRHTAFAAIAENESADPTTAVACSTRPVSKRKRRGSSDESDEYDAQQIAPRVKQRKNDDGYLAVPTIPKIEVTAADVTPMEVSFSESTASNSLIALPAETSVSTASFTTLAHKDEDIHTLSNCCGEPIVPTPVPAETQSDATATTTAPCISQSASGEAAATAMLGVTSDFPPPASPHPRRVLISRSTVKKSTSSKKLVFDVYRSPVKKSDLSDGEDDFWSTPTTRVKSVDDPFNSTPTGFKLPTQNQQQQQEQEKQRLESMLERSALAAERLGTAKSKPSSIPIQMILNSPLKKAATIVGRDEDWWLKSPFKRKQQQSTSSNRFAPPFLHQATKSAAARRLVIDQQEEDTVRSPPRSVQKLVEILSRTKPLSPTRVPSRPRPGAPSTLARRHFDAAAFELMLIDSDEEDDIEDMCDQLRETSPTNVPEYESRGPLPSEILQVMFRQLAASGHHSTVLTCLTVCKMWRDAALKVIWAAPRCNHLNQMVKMCKVLHSGLFLKEMLGGKTSARRLLLADLEKAADEPQSSSSNPPINSSAELQQEQTTLMESHSNISNYASMIRSFTYHYVNPSDRRHPPKFDVVKFLCESFPNLESLHLTGSPDWLDSYLLVRLSKKKRTRRLLKSLVLSGTSKINEEGFQHALPKFGELRVLALENLPQLTDGILCAVAKSCSQLEALRLPHCYKITVHSIRELVRRVPRLRELDLTCCTSLTDEVFDALLAPAVPWVKLSMLVAYDNKRSTIKGPKDEGSINSSNAPSTTRPQQLHSLSLSHCHNLTEGGLISLLANPKITARMPLRYLNISGFPSLSDGTLRLVAETFGSTLETLIIQDCRDITFMGLWAALEKCPRLQLLDVSGCRGLGITGAGLGEKKERRNALAVNARQITGNRHLRITFEYNTPSQTL